MLSLENMTSDDARNYAKRSLIDDINEYYGCANDCLLARLLREKH